MTKVYVVTVDDDNDDYGPAEGVWSVVYSDLEVAKLAVADELLDRWKASSDELDGQVAPPLDWERHEKLVSCWVLYDHLVTGKCWSIQEADLK